MDDISERGEINLETLWVLFITFFKIGLFSFGGGYAILPLIQKEVVEVHSWITVPEFTDIVAVSQVTPGPISINASTYVGYLVTGNAVGAAVATIGLITPSLIIMTIFSMFFLKFKDNKYISRAFKGLRVVVVGLILSATLLLMDRKNFIDIKSFIIFGITMTVFLKWKINPIIITVIVALMGVLIY
ncbi:chromate transporter [Leptotrichia sp. OH3620_COT-345]|uniref:chromate transporter n=1 Tax=Leptotrichia sp. OH3620_COT-345 TaxID=2491048 RepID=UPI000F64D3BD|nr:chromate transporter [Leptotrichia sp. OH3620_COT-345]RRD40227.1 chromate transporter [Leptotrichia sp. OH3620_COT-345]